MSLFRKSFRITCPDGTVRILFKHPDDAFPFFAKEWNAKLQALIKALKKVEIKLGAEFKSTLENYYVELDEANRSVQLHFKALYVAYYCDPCNKSDWFCDQVEMVIKNEQKFRSVEMEIRKLKALINISKTDKELKKQFASLISKASDSILGDDYEK